MTACVKSAPPPLPGAGAGSHLVGLQALRGAIAAVGDEVLAVVPQQAVGHGAHQLLGPPRHLLPGQRAPAHRQVHDVQQDPGSVREVLHRVHADAGALGEHPEHQPRVGHHLPDLRAVSGQRRQDVRDEVRNPVLAQVDAEVGEKSPGNLQQVSPLELVRSSGGLRRRLIPLTAPGERPLCAQRRQQAGQLDVGEEEELLQEEGEGVQHDCDRQTPKKKTKKNKKEEEEKKSLCLIAIFFTPLLLSDLLLSSLENFPPSGRFWRWGEEEGVTSQVM